MRLIDEQYFKTPFYGYPRMTEFLRRSGYGVNEKRVYRLMKKMNLRAVYPKPKTTIRGKGHKVFPYLLRGVKIERNNQVWSTDITFIPMLYGFLYLVAIMDWFSRYVLSWELSNSLDRQFCLEALERPVTERMMNVNYNVIRRIVVYNSVKLNGTYRIRVSAPVNAVLQDRTWNITFSPDSVPRNNTMLDRTAFFVAQIVPGNLHHFWEEEFQHLYPLARRLRLLGANQTNHRVSIASSIGVTE